MTLMTRVLRALSPLLLVAPVLAFAQAQEAPSPKDALREKQDQATPQSNAANFRNSLLGQTAETTEAALPQPQYLNNEDPWIYRGTDIPVDKEWLFGELPNGVRYAVRRNGVPPNQVSIRVRIDAGALHEKDGEQGFAHLLEHMLFRESKYLGKGEAIPTWQRLGASFGSDTNAETSPTHTVYKLDLPDGRRGNLQESMKLVAGMVQAPVLSAENLALDVPIVLAERRESSGAERRMYDGSRETLYAGTRMATRSTIGTVETLEGATPKAIQAFHKRWYRPENTVVVVVGDMDPMLMAQLVEENYADWKVPGKPEKAPDFGKIAPLRKVDPENPVDVARVLVEPGQPRNVTFAYLRPWEQITDNVLYNQGLMLDAVATAIVNRRLEARARSGGNFLVAQVGQEDVYRTADATFVYLIPLSEDWGAAVTDVRTVIDDSLVRPPTQAEIDREVAEIDVSFANRVEQEEIQAGSALADQLIGAVDIREAIASPSVARDIWNSTKPRFTPEEVFARTQQLFAAPAVRGFYVTPSEGEADEASFTAALSAPLDRDDSDREDKTALTFADLPPLGTPTEPVSRERIGIYSIERVEYPNGVRALVWNSENEPGRVTVNVRFGSGWRAFSADQAAIAQVGEAAFVGTGFGQVGQDELDELATGRLFGFDFEIGDGAFTLSARTRMADLEDQLYLFAGKLAEPRFDANPILRARASQKLAYDSMDGTAPGVLNRDLQYYMRGQDGRFATATPAQLDAVTPDSLRDVWAPLLQQGPVEVIVFGDIDPDATIAMIGRTFGALPPRAAIPTEALGRELGFAGAQAAPLVRNHTGDADQAAVVVAWPTGSGNEMLPESRKLDLLSQIFGNRLMEVMREKAGASYAPQVGLNWPTDVGGNGYVIALATLPPEMVPVFFEEADKIADDLAANGPTADELARVTEPMRQLLRRLSTGHSFFLYQLVGSTTDPAIVPAMKTIEADYTRTDPSEMQALAAKYFGRDGWRMAILPPGKTMENVAD